MARTAKQIAAQKKAAAASARARQRRAGTASGASSPFSQSTVNRAKAGAKTKDVVAFGNLSSHAKRVVAKHLGSTVAEMSGSKVKSKLPPPKISHRKGFLANQRRMQGFK